MGFDAVPIDHFQTQLDSAIDDGSLFHDGWKIEVNTYDIMGSDFGHTAIELHGPDGKNFYASLDTYNFNEDGTGTLIPYKPGSEMRMAIDQDREGNVVTKGEPQGRQVLFEGNGAEAVLRFGQILEQAAEFNRSGADYNPTSINTGAFIKSYYAAFNEAARIEDDTQPEYANSNSGPLQVLENLEYDVSKLREVHRDTLDVAGADDDVSRLFIEQGTGFLEALNPESMAAAVGDRDGLIYKNIVELSKTMHPDVISKEMAQEFDKTVKPHPLEYVHDVNF